VKANLGNEKDDSLLRSAAILIPTSSDGIKDVERAEGLYIYIVLLFM